MVSKPVAAVGSVLGLTALAMLISVMVSQNFVVVIVPGTPGNYNSAAGGAGACQAPNYLGTLGIFKASFIPDCTFNPAVQPANPESPLNLQPYAQLPAVTSSTTEFGPLFPAQTCFGGKFSSIGCKFTTCDEFYAAGGNADTTMTIVGASAILKNVSDGLSQSNTVALAKLSPAALILDRIPPLVAGALAGKLIGNSSKTLIDVFGKFQGLLALGKLIEDVVKNTTAGCDASSASVGSLFSTARYDCTQIKQNITALGGCTSNSLPDVYVAFCKALDFFSGTTDGERIDTLASGPFSIIKGGLSRQGKILVGCVAAGAGDLTKCKNDVIPGAGNETVADFESAGTQTLGSLAGFLTVANSNGLKLGEFRSDTYVGENVATLAGLRKYLRNYLNLTQSVAQGLQDAWATLAACNKDTVTECQAPASYAFSAPTEPLKSDSVVSPATVLLDFTIASVNQRARTPVTSCTYTYLIGKLVEEAIMLNGTQLVTAFGQIVADQLATAIKGSGVSAQSTAFSLGQVVNQCRNAGLSGSNCSTAFAAPATGAAAGIPTDFTKIYPGVVGINLLVSGAWAYLNATISAGGSINITASAFQTIGAYVQELQLQPTAVQPTAVWNFKFFLNALAGDAMGAIFRLGPETLANATLNDLVRLAGLRPFAQMALKSNSCDSVACIDAAVKAVIALAPELVLGSVYTNLQVNSSRSGRIADCKNNDMDISAFKTAQAMVTAAAVMMGLGMVAGFAVIAVDKGPVAFGAGALSLIGGLLVIAALIVVKGAPVYAKLGLPPVDGLPKYQAASGQLIAIVGGILAVLGGVAQLVSGCLNKPTSSDQLTTKVENTY